MAVSYPNCVHFPKISSKRHPFNSSTGLSCRASPVFVCLKNSDPDLRIGAKLMPVTIPRGMLKNFHSDVEFLRLRQVACELKNSVELVLSGFQRRKLSYVLLVGPLLDSVKWDDKGLAVAIAQNVDTGAILMQGFINREALLTTISSQKATFYSRSRSALWTKGETSNNFINVSDIFLDCDRDSVIYHGKPDGPTCHTGSETCYYTSVDGFLNNPEVDANKLALTTLYSLESTICQRKEELSGSPNGKPSWTKRLLLDEKLLCSKIREEADELCRTLEENEDKSRTASEMADVLYHAMVLLARRGVRVEDVLQVLRVRFVQSGIEEKSSRKQ